MPLHDPRGTAYEVEGAAGTTAAPLVLIHGVGLDRTMWRAQSAALAPLGPYLVYDMLGHGGSPNPPGPRDLDDFVAQLEGLLDHLEIDRCRLIGFSMGGLVARAFAASAPDRVEALVLMSTVTDRNAEERQAVEARCKALAAQGAAATVEAALTRWFTPDFATSKPETIDAVRRRILDNDPDGFLKAYRVFASADRAEDAALARIACPCLVLTGEADANSTPAMTEALAARIPKARALVLPQRRHMMPMEAAEEINAELVDFFQSAKPA